MILVDTNVLVALMVDGRESQREEALAMLAQFEVDGELASVCESLLVETCWVLERSYRLPRPDVAQAVRKLISTSPLRAWDPGLADAALALMGRRPAFSVTDALLLRRAADTGNPVMSFDAGLVREADPST